MRLREDSRICETLGEDLQGIHEEVLQGFTRLWERISEERICETLGEDL